MIEVLNELIDEVFEVLKNVQENRDFINKNVDLFIRCSDRADIIYESIFTYESIEFEECYEYKVSKEEYRYLGFL